MNRIRNSQSYATDDSATSDDNESVPDLAPDGGWGWVVCFGAFMAFFILDGTMFSFGVLLIDLLEYFGTSKGKTAMVGSVLLGLSMLMGPLVGFLLDRFSCRQVTIAGTLIAFSGFVVSIFSPNVEILILTYGVVGGIGFCMVYITSVITVNIYFARKRALATGIALSGAGIGIFTYGYLCDILLSEFDWRGTVLILSGILLNCLISGSVFRPILPKAMVYKTDILERDSLSDKVIYPWSSDIKVDQTGLLTNDMKSGNPLLLFGSNPDCKLFKTKYSSHKDIYNYDSLNHKKYYSDVNLYSVNDQVTIGYLRPMSRKDIFYSGSIRNLSLTEKDSFADSDSDSSSDTSTSQCCPTGSRCTSCRLLHFVRIFKDVKFLVLLVSCIMWTAQSITVTYIPDMALSKNIDKSQCAFLISIVGISNTLARAVAGVLTDICGIRSSYIYVSTLFVACAVNLVLPWCADFPQLAACAGVFGFCMGSIVALRTIVLADHLGINQLTKAFGIVAMFQGISFTVVPPIAGSLFDFTGSYLCPFVLVSGMYLISGVICLPLLRSKPHLQSIETIDIIITEDTSVHDSESIGSAD